MLVPLTDRRPRSSHHPQPARKFIEPEQVLDMIDVDSDAGRPFLVTGYDDIIAAAGERPSVNETRPHLAEPTRENRTSRVPFAEQFGALLGMDLSDVAVEFGPGDNAGAQAASAAVEAVGQRRRVWFERPNPTPEQVAHEVIHLAQQMRFGDASQEGLSHHEDSAEREARELAAALVAGRPVAVHQRPAGSVQRDDDIDDPAARIHANLHGWIDDEAGAVAELRAVDDVKATAILYRARYGIELWDDFQGNASGVPLRDALGLLWSCMSVTDRLESHKWWGNDNEDAMLQTILSATDAEILAVRDQLTPWLDELSDEDAFRARCRIWPELPVENVASFVAASDSWIWDDEGPATTAILSLSPEQRLRLWNEHAYAFSMYNDHDHKLIRRMCEGNDLGVATEASALDARMKLATEGLGTDDDGAQVAVSVAAARKQEYDTATSGPGRAPLSRADEGARVPGRGDRE